MFIIPAILLILENYLKKYLGNIIQEILCDYISPLSKCLVYSKQSI